MPTNKPREIIISYDIANPRRLQRVHRLLKRIAIPLQYSVFYTRMSDRQRTKLITLLEHKINPKEDDIRIYPLTKNYLALYIGQSPFMEGLQLEWQRGEWQQAMTKAFKDHEHKGKKRAKP